MLNKLEVLLKKVSILALFLLFVMTVGFFDFKDSVAVNLDMPIDETYLDEIVENKIDINFDELGTMKASWYGPKFHGKNTANGEVYDQYSFTAAHKKLPFGTMLKVTNPENGKFVVVRINDRGPYIKGRQLDLSKSAALALGMMDEGVIKVNVEKVVLPTYL